MKNIFVVGLIFLMACGSSKNGMQEIKGPFDGSSYRSNGRFFRAVASGESQQMETAKSKALLLANQRLASAVQTEMKSVSESYVNERNLGTPADFGERFQQLTREVLSTSLSDVRTIGNKTYLRKDNVYVQWVALEMHKKDYYKKIQLRLADQKNLSEKEKKVVEKMIEKAIEDSEKD